MESNCFWIRASIIILKRYSSTEECSVYEMTLCWTGRYFVKEDTKLNQKSIGLIRTYMVKAGNITKVQFCMAELIELVLTNRFSIEVERCSVITMIFGWTADVWLNKNMPGLTEKCLIGSEDKRNQKIFKWIGGCFKEWWYSDVSGDNELSQEQFCRKDIIGWN